MFLPWVMWFLPLIFFAYQFILRLFPGLVMAQMIDKFGINVGDFGFLSALYYFGYAGAQIPISVLIDRIGVRNAVFFCAVLAGAASMVTSLTSSWSFVLLCRFVTGVVSAAGLLGVSKALSIWFPSKLYSRMLGYTFTIGLLGAVYGGAPFQYIIETFGWEDSIKYLGLVGVLIGFVVFLFFRNKSFFVEQDQELFLSDFKIILSKPVLILAGANFLMVGTLEGFADVWGVNYLTVIGFEKADAIFIVSFVFIGMIIGAPLISRLAEKYNLCDLIAISGVLMALIMLFITFFAKLLFNDQYIIIAMLLVAGTFCCYQIFVFDAGSKLVSQKLSGITIAFLNCINMLGGSFFHSVIGYSLTSITDNIEVSYKIALSFIPLAAVIGAFMALSIRGKVRNASLLH